MISHVLKEACEGKHKNISEVYLHVQTNNDAALKFYKESFGFEEGGIVPNYYKKIEPSDAYILRKPIVYTGVSSSAGKA